MRNKTKATETIVKAVNAATNTEPPQPKFYAVITGTRKGWEVEVKAHNLPSDEKLDDYGYTLASISAQNTYEADIVAEAARVLNAYRAAYERCHTTYDIVT